MEAAVLVVHQGRPHAAELARAACAWLVERGYEVRLPIADAAVAGLEDHAVADGELMRDASLAVSLGGDGTMLRTVDMAIPFDVPVIGVNVGMLGYLTEIEPPNLLHALERFRQGAHRIAERMLLEVRVDDGGVFHALNEAVVEKTATGHTVRLEVEIDGEPFTSYAADGLIVATPTGSTAYSMSARGPIVSPQHRALILTPVSPHMLFDRALVLDPEETVRIVVGGHNPAVLSIDGRVCGELTVGRGVSCTAAQRSAKLVTFEPRRFHQILKQKFGLADR